MFVKHMGVVSIFPCSTTIFTVALSSLSLYYSLFGETLVCRILCVVMRGVLTYSMYNVLHTHKLTYIGKVLR